MSVPRSMSRAFVAARITCRCSLTSTRHASCSPPLAVTAAPTPVLPRILSLTAAEPNRSGRSARTCPRPYLAGALKHLPAAEIMFDRYHVKAQLSKAVDEVRKAERGDHADLLRHSRYLWLRNPRSHRRPGQLPARPGNRRQGGHATDLSTLNKPVTVGRFVATSGEKTWPSMGRKHGREWGETDGR